MSKLQAKALAQAVIDANREADEFFAPHVEKWLDIQVKLDLLDEDLAERCFRPVSITDVSIRFDCEPFEVHDYRSFWRDGTSITVPLDFFDNPEPYEQQVKDHLDTIEAARKSNDRYKKLARVADLQAALEKAKKEAGL